MGHVFFNLVFASCDLVLRSCIALYASKAHTNFEVCSLAIPETWTKFKNLKVGQDDLDYDHFWLIFVPLIFYSL